MLVNILLYNGPKDPTMEAILAILGQGGKVERIDTGVYDCPHFNFSNEVGIHEYDDKYPHLTRITSEEDIAVALANDRPVYESFGCYGVCDNYKQVIEQCKELQPSDPGLYIMSVTRVSRDEQPAEGGWRWHKWGEYIGARSTSTSTTRRTSTRSSATTFFMCPRTWPLSCQCKKWCTSRADWL